MLIHDNYIKSTPLGSRGAKDRKIIKSFVEGHAAFLNLVWELLLLQPNGPDSPAGVLLTNSYANILEVPNPDKPEELLGSPRLLGWRRLGFGCLSGFGSSWLSSPATGCSVVRSLILGLCDFCTAQRPFNPETPETTRKARSRKVSFSLVYYEKEEGPKSAKAAASG